MPTKRILHRVPTESTPSKSFLLAGKNEKTQQALVLDTIASSDVNLDFGRPQTVSGPAHPHPPENLTTQGNSTDRRFRSHTPRFEELETPTAFRYNSNKGIRPASRLAAAL